MLDEVSEEVDMDSEDLRDQLNDEEIEASKFCKKYTKERTKYHRYMILRERLVRS